MRSRIDRCSSSPSALPTRRGARGRKKVPSPRRATSIGAPAPFRDSFTPIAGQPKTMADGVAEHPVQRSIRQRPCRRAMRISPPTSPCVPANQAGSSLPRQSSLRFHWIGEQAVRFSSMARAWQPWRTCRPGRSSRISAAIGASRDRTGQGRRPRESTASRTPGVSICTGARQRWRVRACRAFVLDAVS